MEVGGREFLNIVTTCGKDLGRDDEQRLLGKRLKSPEVPWEQQRAPHLRLKKGFVGCWGILPRQNEKPLESDSDSVVSDPMKCSLPGSSVHGVLQARMLEWVAVSYSRGSSWAADWTWVSHIAGRFFTVWSHKRSFRYRKLQQNLCLENINLVPMWWIKSRESKKESRKTNRAAIAVIGAIMYGSLGWIEMRKVDLPGVFINDLTRTGWWIWCEKWRKGSWQRWLSGPWSGEPAGWRPSAWRFEPHTCCMLCKLSAIVSQASK